ncbi:phosphoglycerate mutase family protein [Carboxylicivirga marina]|uniref:Phosphoglycerate mutase family protein n=2 Tax=Carboxylicivirga TaxID=1628153 RepID=A0ABS1HP89_9BACT|nr:phosphoglycerate mutase family protein [Carboxylicivirga marina]MBK3519507.1 phosphoglycerate mutase family protein [Carboxylicivirga marina]
MSWLFISCTGTKRLTKEAYLHGFKDKSAFTNIESFGSQDSTKLRIYLIRHAKPDVKKKKICTSAMAQAYVDAYSKVPIIPFDTSLVQFSLDDEQVIYCSNLRRAEETANAIFGKVYTIKSDAQFREFETRIIALSNAYTLPLIVWQTLSRAAWVLGLNQKGIESYKQAKIRSQQAALRLALLAQEEQTVVLVAHGMLNRSIAKKLKQQGWCILQKQGHINIGATVLVKEKDESL